MEIVFGEARPEDFDYCARLYFAAHGGDDPRARARHRPATAGFCNRWSAAETRIIARAGSEAGWLQTAAEGDALSCSSMHRCETRA